MSILVIGNCTVDVAFAVPRFPRAGETLLARERRVDLGGKGANQAVAAHRFGAETRLAAPVGRDAEGDWAVARLAAEGLDGAGLTRVAAATDLSVLHVTPDGENAIVSSHDAAAAVTPAWAAAAVEMVGRSSTLLLQGNLAEPVTRAALDAARRRGLRRIVNPAPIEYDWAALLPLADIVIVNALEAATLGGGTEPVEAARALLDKGAPSVVVTLGARGAVAMGRIGARTVDAPKVEAIDAVGAGDTFCGAFAAALDRGLGTEAALRIAVEGAALTVTRRGTQTSFPTRAEAAAILARHRAA